MVGRVIATCPHCKANLVDVGNASGKVEWTAPQGAVSMDEARLSAILGRAVAKQAETIAAQADQIVSLSKS